MNQENFKNMTRKQLVRYIVLNQYAKGLISIKHLGYQAKVRLDGGAGIKPQTKEQLIKAAIAISE